mmetsp:Transcript_17428/g.21179  ORF Transcript_17428/g.21179 Transcript_17428/m.21179 type:complete len:956 (-) Transcript_17428:1356-4223(-)
MAEASPLLDSDDLEAPLSAEDLEQREIEFATQTGDAGLSEAEAAARLEQYGPNLLEEPKKNEILVFLSFFTGPMPIMIWLATLVVALMEDWDDFSVLMTLQAVNGIVGYLEEKSAGDAIAALKQSLSPRASVKREGEFRFIEAKFLVPGDVINLKLGDIVPADCRLQAGKPLEVDQAALTGESLPVTRGHNETVYMGSIVRRGEVEAWVIHTGARTFFGKAATMVNQAAEGQQGRFARIMFQNTMVLFVLSVSLCAVIFVEVYRSGLDLLESLSVVVVILVASIPIAMQIVSTTVMAVGGRTLAEKKAILSRLSAIEELAGMDILCSDKTGTLTQNKLQLFEPVLVDTNITANELVFLGALAAKRMSSGADAIDTVIVSSVADADRPRLDDFEELDFIPFDPAIRRTEARLLGPDGQELRVTKGATKTVLNMCADKNKITDQVLLANETLAKRGFRSLGVAVAKGGATASWQFCGVLSMFDPPRTDTKQTLEKARDMGISVKMITGDQTAIAVETSKAIGLSSRSEPEILDMKEFTAAEKLGVSAATNLCERVDGFAEVYPEHKYRIVELLQHSKRYSPDGHTVGMTGDGVNDAPALKKANIGIAVEGSTDAARAAADIVLTEPGLSVIIDAIITARCIFARVRNYVIYRIACTLQLVLFFFLACLIFRPRNYYCWHDRDGAKISGSVFSSCNYDLALDEDDGICHDYDESSCKYPYYYPSAEYSFSLPVLGIVIIAILNDGCMLTIARDHVIPAETPQQWDLNQLRIVACVLGAVPLFSSLLLLYLGLSSADGLYPWYAVLFGKKVPNDYQNDADDRYYLPYSELIMIMYLKISISDFLTLFAARTRGLFCSRRPSLPLFGAFLIATITATLIASLAYLPDKTYPMSPISSTACAFVWAYNFFFFLVQDSLKALLYKIFAARLNPDAGKPGVKSLDDTTVLTAAQKKARALIES